jgi:type II secretory pathway pseudopilin PulG
MSESVNRRLVTPADERGYAMAALLVALSVMAILMTVAMPVWKQATQREKEAELVFRGEQYVHAIALYSRKLPGALPPSLDILVEQHFLRKKYKDPITNGDFQPLTQAQAAAGTTQTPGRGASPGGSSARGVGTSPPSSGASPFAAQPARGGAPSPGAPAGGIIGVVSKSKDTSIRLYKGRSHYNEWAFVYTPPAATPGAGPPGSVAPGQRQGQPGQGPQPGAPGAGPFGPGRRGGPPTPGGRGVNPTGPTPPPRRGGA